MRNEGRKLAVDGLEGQKKKFVLKLQPVEKEVNKLNSVAFCFLHFKMNVHF